jgi:heat shock protein HspQ
MVLSESIMDKTAKYNIGDLVVHTHHGYRAVVIDIDPLFLASGRFNPQAPKRDFSTRNPWYRLLVDGSSQTTYVEEPLLALDASHDMIDNPNIGDYLIPQSGRYRSNIHRH